MADSQGRSQYDTGYDPYSDPDSGVYGQNDPSQSPPQSQPGMGPSVGATPEQMAAKNAALNPSSANDWSTGPWDAARVSQYFQSRGVTPNGTSPDYWAQKWNEWGSKDPAYFLQRLSTADEFGGGGNAGGGSGSFAINPDYLRPFTEQFTIPGDPNNPASAAFAANPQAFKLPSESDLFASPGFKGAQTAATNAVVNSNAAKGLINSGGSIYDIANTTAGLEGQQYQNLVNNQANAYGLNIGAGQNAFNNAWQQYLGRQNLFFRNQDAPFSKIAQIANIGLGAASQ